MHFERRGNSLYWKHYHVADFVSGVCHAITNEVEDELFGPDLYFDSAPIVDEIMRIRAHMEFLKKKIVRLVLARNEIAADMMELEASSVRVTIDQQLDSVAISLKRVAEAIDAIEVELNDKG